MRNEYLMPIVISRSMIRVGGEPVPGVIGMDSIVVQKAPDLPDQWEMTAVFVTGTEPSLTQGVTLLDNGHVHRPACRVCRRR